MLIKTPRSPTFSNSTSNSTPASPSRFLRECCSMEIMMTIQSNKSGRRRDLINNLPNELMEVILSFLPLHDLFQSATRISWSWNLASRCILTQVRVATMVRNKSATAVTDQIIMKIAPYCMRVDTVDLSWCVRITDASLHALCDHISPNTLRHLSLAQCENITDEGLRALPRFKNLETLNLFGCRRITDSGLRHLRGLTKLKIISLALCDSITDEGLEHLRDMTQLQSLILNNCRKVKKTITTATNANTLAAAASLTTTTTRTTTHMIRAYAC
eukprot:GEZU01030145.1.p1 GENE.GEZU01030145.1~~GEZU01030145.1.p1  ORF type:complete len:273 (-),score=51.56 GEZU01030145.1:18-836(-)